MILILFDLRPKENRQELYGRDAELNKLANMLNSDIPLILLFGIRRVGKTSLLKTCLNELKQPWIYIDARRLDIEGYSKFVLYKILSDEFTRLSSTWTKLKDVLRMIKGVQIMGMQVEFDWSKKGLLLSSLFNSINEWMEKEDRYLVIAIDEAQLLRNMKGGKGKIDFRKIIAYCYDNLSRIKFLLTGSEMGLLTDFIGTEDYESPLYGRGRGELILERFSEDKSISYLEAGFNEYGMNVNVDMLKKIVDKLDGIVGWLTLIGNTSIKIKKLNDEVIESVIDMAKGMVRNEIQKLLQTSRYYGLILRSIARGSTYWKDIKMDVESWMNKPVTNSQISRALETLLKLSIIEKRDGGYFIIDPIIKEFSKEL
ncbi:MAG: AAA family ATPase [Thermoprotei archaeon]|mgnify:CR=1 FL=1